MIKNPIILQKKVPAPSKFAQLINGTLTEVTEEDLQGVTKIRNYAFNNQPLITRVKLPNTIQEIGAGAFQNCTNLSELNLDDNIIYIGNYFISSCVNLNLTYIQPPTTQISDRAFSGAKGVVVLAIGGVLNKIFGTCLDSANNTKLVKFNEEVTLTGNIYNNTGQPKDCIYDFPTTILSIGMVGTSDSQFAFTIIRAVNPPTLTASNNLGNTKPRFVPYESIDLYKSATNWSAKANYIYPFVYDLEDLSKIDTSKYTKALHIVDKDAVSLDNYTIYNYTNGEWIKE